MSDTLRLSPGMNLRCVENVGKVIQCHNASGGQRPDGFGVMCTVCNALHDRT